VGRLPITQVDARILDRFYAHLEREGLSASTIRSVHALIRGALRQAVRWGWLATNVARDARPPTVRRADVALPSPAEIGRALAAAEAIAPEFGTFVRVVAATGARRGEICALRWQAVDLDAGTVRIDASAVAAPGETRVKDTKTHTRRVVTQDPETVANLRAHRRLTSARALAAGSRLADDGYAFSAEVDGALPWRPDAVSKRWARARRVAGLDGVRVHDLRHFQATMLLRRLGHRDAATTLNVYAQFLEEADRESAELIGRLLPGGDGSADQSGDRPRRKRS
jgi:integrase